MVRPQSTHGMGVLLVVVSAVVFSMAGIFTNGVPTGAWDVIFWRGLAAAAFTLSYLAAIGQLKHEIRAFRGPACLVTLLMAAGTAAFIPAFKLSSVANVALIYSAAPFLAAGLSWLLLKEKPAQTVLIASVVSVFGVALILSGSAYSGHVLGSLLALFMTLMMSAVMVAYRRWPNTTAALPAALSSLVLLPIAAAFSNPMAVPLPELPMLLVFGLVFAVASVTLSEGARRLPSAEAALLSALETPLAPVLAFLFLREVPTGIVVLGGGLVFVAVLVSQSSWPLKKWASTD